MEGSRWFRRLRKECNRISPHIRFRRIKLGFYRVYWKQAYIHEVYKDMPETGYDIDTYNPKLENRSYVEKKEDRAELTRNLKNYVEGYRDSIDRIRTRVYMMKHDKEFNETATKAYQQVVIK